MRSLHDLATRLWKGELGAAGAALDIAMTPAAALYNAAITARNRMYDAGTFASENIDAPVISIGNIAVGGTGKTPVTAWLARDLRDAGCRPAVLHGGYAADEPALHRESNPDIPVVVGRDRIASAHRAIKHGANVILLDDAFQHRRIRRNLDIVLIGAESWSGDVRVLPRGPWREEPAALQRAHWIVVTRRTADANQARDVMRALQSVAPRANTAILNLNASRWIRDGQAASAPQGPSLAVAGIAGPETFLANATAAGAAVTAHLYYPDHHAYTNADAAEIMRRAGKGSIVTTAKDWTKLRALLPHDRAWVLSESVEPEERGAMLLDAVRTVAGCAA